mgnify:CR=1 FL=1
MTRNIQQLFDLKGKTALVTGGSRGLGLQMAHALGEAGARVVISSRKATDLEEATAELQAAGIDARWIAADCSLEEDIRRLTSETLQRVGDVDILVNNAGAAWGAPAEDHPLEAWDKVMNLNVRSYFLLSQLIAKGSMIPRKKGSIINTASIAGLGGNPNAVDLDDVMGLLKDRAETLNQLAEGAMLFCRDFAGVDPTLAGEATAAGPGAGGAAGGVGVQCADEGKQEQPFGIGFGIARKRCNLWQPRTEEQHQLLRQQ